MRKVILTNASTTPSHVVGNEDLPLCSRTHDLRIHSRSYFAKTILVKSGLLHIMRSF